MTALKKGYVICGYARTGGSLLAKALQATGQLGYAQEYFNPNAIPVERGERYPHDRQAQLAEIAARGTSANGVYGLKIFCDQFDALAGFDWAGALPNLHFIHLERRDALGQAMSCVRATQTGAWDSSKPSGAEPHYDEAAILGELTRFAHDRARWQLFFARNGIRPLWLVYEDMAEALPQTVRAVAALMGVDDLPDPLTGLAQLAVQRDAITQEWRTRFLAGQGDRTRLDNLVPVPQVKRKWGRLWF